MRNSLCTAIITPQKRKKKRKEKPVKSSLSLGSAVIYGLPVIGSMTQPPDHMAPQRDAGSTFSVLVS